MVNVGRAGEGGSRKESGRWMEVGGWVSVGGIGGEENREESVECVGVD